MKHIFEFFRRVRSPRHLSPSAPLSRGAETKKTDMPLTPAAQGNTAFSFLNKGGCPKDKGDLPTSNESGANVLHTLREKEFAAPLNRYSI